MSGIPRWVVQAVGVLAALAILFWLGTEVVRNF